MAYFKRGIMIMTIVFAFQREGYNLAAAENVLVSLCNNEVNMEYSSMEMSDTASLIDLVPSNQYSYHIFKSYNVNGKNSPAWAHGACNGQVDARRCRGCLVEALYNLNNCLGKTGGQVKLTNCRLRYETYTFNWDW